MVEEESALLADNDILAFVDQRCHILHSLYIIYNKN